MGVSMEIACKIRGKEFSLQNPLMTAPGSFGNVLEYQDFVDFGRLGAVIPNSMLKEDGEPNGINKFMMTDTGYLSSFGPNNMGLGTFIREVLPKLPAHTAPVIVDIKARSMEEMGESVALAAKTEGIAAIEVNLNCPYASPEEPYWKNPQKLEELMKLTRKEAGEKVLIAKAPGGVYSMTEMAKVLEKAGCDMFVPFNCIDGCAVDVRSRTLQTGGFFGRGIKAFALSRCKEAAAAFHIPVIGAGGITCAKDVLEYIMVGAFAVQVGSANLTRPDFMMRLLEELQGLLEELSIDSLEEVRGCAKMVKRNIF